MVFGSGGFNEVRRERLLSRGRFTFLATGPASARIIRAIERKPMKTSVKPTPDMVTKKNASALADLRPVISVKQL